ETARRKCDGSPLRDSEQRKPSNTRRLHNRFQIDDRRVQGNFRNVPIRQTVAARVIAYEGSLVSQPVKKVTPNRRVPIVIEMVQKIPRLNDGRSASNCCPSQTNAVDRSAKMYFL